MHTLFKRFSLYLIIFFGLFLTNKVSAVNAYFIWEKTEITVPVFSNLEDYKDDYVVKLYVNGKLSNDYYVEAEVNCSTFSTVLTNKIGRYTVYYKAYSKQNYISSMAAIVFSVVDINAPTIKLNSDIIEVKYGSSLSDDWYKITDDTCLPTEINVAIDDSNVIYNTLGTYPATITATDLYGNSNKRDFKVKITDKNNPKIYILKPLEFAYGEDINISDYFMCKDDYYNDITHLMILSGLDIYKLGRQQVELSVTDYYNNKTEVIMEVLVLDKIPPTLILTEQEITLDIVDFNNFNQDFFALYIHYLDDNYSDITKIKLLIDTEELQEKIADFHVYFTAIDENNNIKKDVLLVKLREFVGPNIIGEDFIEILKGSEIDLASLVIVEDKYDLEAYQRLSIDQGDFDINNEGIYKIVYTCFNTSGIYTEKIIEIKVIDEANNQNTSSQRFESDIFMLGMIFLSVIIVIAFLAVRIFKKKKNN